MKRFSQRKGLKPIKTKIQIDSMDSDLRNRLWNALEFYYWAQLEGKVKRGHSVNVMTDHPSLWRLLKKMWDEHFRDSLDTLPAWWGSIRKRLRAHFSDRSSWYEVYDFIEFMANNHPSTQTNVAFMRRCNQILESEISAYRFVGGRITQTTSEEEISEIEEALATPLKPVRTHLRKALDLLSDKKAPDY